MAVKGVKFTEEHKCKMRETRKFMIAKKIKNNEQLPANRVPVIQLTKSGKFVADFESGLDAYDKTSICHIHDVCNGKRKTAGGYIWKRRES